MQNTPPTGMDHAQAVLAGMEAPTVEDFIEWHEEQAFRLGELGFTMGSYRAEDFFKQWSDVSDLAEAFSKENCAQEAMEQLHADVTRLQQRMRIMRSNPPLLALTENEVQRRLLQAGQSQPDIEHFFKSKPSLRQKIVKLHKLEHRTEPRKPDGVTAWVCMGPNHERKMKMINLPIKASLSEVCRLLEGIKISEMPFEASATGTQSINAESVWKYQLVDKKKLLSKSSVKLRTDADYHKMIAQITRKQKDINPPQAVITLADFPRQQAPSSQLTEIEKMNIGEESADNVLDENGDPFFQPIDWSTMGQKIRDGEVT